MQSFGIMGGTFDPIHNGHLCVAQAAQEQFHLDRVLFIPTGTPPHKLHLMTSGEDRLKMVRLAVAPFPWVQVMDMELQRAGTTYSVDTLHDLYALFPDTNFYFIIGEDTLPLLPTWHKACEVARLTHFLVMARKGVTLNLKEAAEYAREKIGASVFFMKGEGPEISSSRIRILAQEGRDISPYVPRPVQDYLTIRQLYLPQKEENAR